MFAVRPLHSKEQIDQELMLAIDSGKHLTLGDLLSLKMNGSPYIEGGEFNEQDLLEAMKITGETTPQGAYIRIKEEIDAASRVFEIFQKDRQCSAKSKYADYSPEWAMDIIAMAANALPSLRYREAFWEMPLAALVHLAAAGYRKSGGCTRRPDNDAEIMAYLKKTRTCTNA